MLHPPKKNGKGKCSTFFICLSTSTVNTNKTGQSALLGYALQLKLIVGR